MHFPLTPIMIGVLAAALPATLPIVSLAAELGQVDVSDPLGASQIALEAGSTVTYTGTGSAINVSTSGNRLTGDGIRITAAGVGTSRAIGVMASQGGAVELTNSSVSSIGTQQSGHALYATGAGSAISGANLQLSSVGTYAYGAYAQAGGQIFLQGGAVSTTGNVSHGLYADGAGSLITAQSLDIRPTGINSAAVNANNGARAELTNVVAANASGTALSADGVGSTLDLKNTTVSAAAGSGIYVRSAALSMQGGSVTSSGDAVMLALTYGASGGTAAIRDATLNAGNGYGVNINGQGSSATLENVSISALGSRGTGVWLPSIDTTLVARNVDIDSWMVGIDNRAGRVTLQGGSVETFGDNAHGLYVSREYGTAASIDATGTRVKTSGAGAVGALARVSGASVRLTNASVTTEGATAYGLFASGTDSELTATGTAVTTSGAGASGLAMSNRTAVTLDSTQLAVRGAGAHGIWSYGTAADVTNNLLLKNGSRIDTTDGVGLLASGGDHNFALRDTTVATRTGGDDNTGVLLQSRAVNVTSGGVTTVIQTGRVNLDADASLMTGDVVADSGAIDIALKKASVLTGALVARTGQIDSMSVDNTSAWNVRADSALGTLTNTGTVRFAAPNAQSGFKTLTVNNYAGGGTLVMNTQLGDDTSPTDKLVIDGGTTSGTTGLRIMNANGTGGQTQQGIRLVQAINGGTTTADAFHLDSKSTGFRASTGTVALRGYDYSLVKGGNQGVESDWYLTSTYQPGTVSPIIPELPGVTPAPDPGTPPTPSVPVDPDPLQPPVDPVLPVTPSQPAPPAGAQFTNVSPESGAYVGNQLAATRMFMHQLKDRDDGSVLSGVDADGKARDGVWIRANGTRQDRLRMNRGDVNVDTDSSMVQIGGDVLHAPLGKDGQLVAGVMAGYGDARAHSRSRLMLPGSNDTVGADAQGKVRGYSAGVYATAYADSATRMGAYADSWLQYGRYSNQISSELGAASYRSNTWTVSVETGYAFAPFAPDSALSAMVVVPQAQIAYTHYDAKDVSLPGVTYKGDSTGAVNTRAGVRVYPFGMARAGAPVRPFVEANWLHGTDNPQANTGAGTFGAVPPRNGAELKVGAQGRIGKSTSLTGYVSGQSGSGGQRGFGGMLNLSYRW
ncbi:autotransporter outer membrane beta-barrel domain-containing protein [Achromobacter spanius]|uniref:autotransporter family protein n=1 Tax=Achromobacter spanius TaxID=217203 RepID=UPI003209C278